MTRSFKNILFVAEGAPSEKSAVVRAQQLAKRTGGRLTLVGVVAHVSTDDVQLTASIKRLQNALVKEKQEEIQKLTAGLEGRKPRIVIVHGKYDAEINELVVQENYDLVVKAANPGSILGNMVFGNTDIRLIHYCPCPVLVLKPTRRKSMRNIVAAVDPMTESAEAMHLNEQIVTVAASLAELESSNLHLVHVIDHPAFTRSFGKRSDFKKLAEALREKIDIEMASLVDKFEHLHLEDHILQGSPGKTIAKFNNDNDTDLLVLGSVARSGVANILIGNTAEKILNEVDCSVLTLKPEGWEPPEIP